MAAQADYSKTFKAECSGRHERVKSLECMYWALEAKPYTILGAGIFLGLGCHPSHKLERMPSKGILRWLEFIRL